MPIPEATNPYASPQSGIDAEESQPRKTQWQFIVTAPLAIFSSLFLLLHLYMLVMLVWHYFSYGWIDPIFPPFGSAQQALFGIILIPVFTFGIGGDLLGIMAARNCWQGRWFRSICQTVVFIGSMVLSYYCLSFFAEQL